VKVLQKGRIRGAWGTAESVPLSKDYEALTDTSETWIDIAMVSILLRRNHEDDIPNTF